MTPYSKARRSRMAQDKDVKESLVSCLKELHLPAFRTSYEELARQAQQEGLSFEQYLLGLARAGMPGTAEQACRAPAARLTAAAGEELVGVGPETAAGQSRAAGGNAAGGVVP